MKEKPPEIKRLIAKADSLFKISADAWVEGNNSGNAAKLRFCESICTAKRRDAEDLLRPLGIKCDYPGLYPCFRVNGFTYYTTERAVEAALERKEQAV